MNDLAAKIEESDPAYARRYRRQNALLGISLVLAFAAIVAGVQALLVNSEQSDRILRVERASVCAADASGAECQAIRAEGARTASIGVTCIPFRKVGYRCPQPDAKAAKRHREATAAGGRAPGARDVAQAPSVQPPSGSQPTAPDNEGGGGNGNHAGQPPALQEPPHIPPNSGSAGQPSQPAVPDRPPSSNGTSAIQPTPRAGAPTDPPAPTPPAEHPVVQGVGTTVQELGSAVRETGEGVNDTLDVLTCTLHLPPC